MTSIEVTADPVEAIDVTLVGEKYELYPPKAAFTLAIVQKGREAEKAGDEDDTAVMDKWLDAAFGKKVADTIKKRRDAPVQDDLLDLPHLNELLEKVIEIQGGGNPTS